MGELIIEGICPVCEGEAISNTAYKMQDATTKDITHWNHCRCGVIWQKEPAQDPKEAFDKKYMDILLQDKEKYADACMYPCRIYAPIIEESIYGRKLLDVGYASPYNMVAFRKRGWVTYGIDIADHSEESKRLIRADFEELEFPEQMKFDLIWLSNVIEHFKDPKKALKKCYDILQPNGMIFIATPDTDFVYNNSVANFSHWNKANFIMWSCSSLKAYLEKLGFIVQLQRRSYEKRTTSWDVQHVIAQKRYY